MEAKGKALLRLCTITWEIDQYCPKDFRPAHTTIAKVSIPNSYVKNLGAEELKVRIEEMVTQCTNNIETFEKAWKKEKKSWRN